MIFEQRVEYFVTFDWLKGTKISPTCEKLVNCLSSNQINPHTLVSSDGAPSENRVDLNFILVQERMKISIFAFLAFASADDSKKGPLVTDKVMTNEI